MLTPDEEKFLIYWEENRDKKISLWAELSVGLRFGLLISVAIILTYVTGWYERATMAANGQSTPLVLVFGLILIIIFCSVFYQRHRREMNEQRYLELKYKQKTENSAASVQQDGDISSQVNN